MNNPEPVEVVAPTDDEPTTYDDVNRYVAEVARAEATLERLRAWFKARESGLVDRAAYYRELIRPFALGFRAETGTSEMPVLGGTVRIRKLPPRVFRNDEALAAFAEARGLAGNAEYQKTEWRYGALVKLLAFPEPDDEGRAQAFDPETGESIEGVEKVWPNEYGVSVSAKLEDESL